MQHRKLSEITEMMLRIIVNLLLGKWAARGLFFLALVLSSIGIEAGVVEGIRIRPSPERTRIVFDVSQPIEHRIFILKNPRRLVIDISDAELKTDLGKFSLRKTPITAVRHARRDNNDLRVVLDLKSDVKPRSFVLKPIMQYGDRLVVDLYTKDQQYTPVIQQSNFSVNKLSDLVIAIDAGHGGDDPGAVGYGKLLEKNVVLQISKRLNNLVEKETGFKSIMIRSGDYYLGRRERTKLARKNSANIFVSIHADAFKTAAARGASVYAVSSKGATSEMARWLAESENRADLIGGVGGVSLDDKDDILAGVLLDLISNLSLSASLDVGASIIESLKDVTKMHGTKVEQAGFAVLKSPDMPSVLVETGYISNPKDASLLKSKRHQQKLAKAIFTGVKNYLVANPPDGSYLAWKKTESPRSLLTYVIERGDTLSNIADKYRVSTEKIKKANGLRTDSIRIGQELKIPGS